VRYGHRADVRHERCRCEYRRTKSRPDDQWLAALHYALTDDQGLTPAQFARREHFREIADYIDAVDGAKHPCTPKHKHKHGPGPA